MNFAEHSDAKTDIAEPSLSVEDNLSAGGVLTSCGCVPPHVENFLGVRVGFRTLPFSNRQLLGRCDDGQPRRWHDTC